MNASLPANATATHLIQPIALGNGEGGGGGLWLDSLLIMYHSVYDFTLFPIIPPSCIGTAALNVSSILAAADNGTAGERMVSRFLDFRLMCRLACVSRPLHFLYIFHPRSMGDRT